MAKPKDTVTFPTVKRERGGKSLLGNEEQLQQLRQRLSQELNNTLIANLKSQSLVKEVWFPLQGDGDTTTSTSFTDVTDSIVKIRMKDWLYYSMFLEVVGKVSANTAEFRLFNITDNEAVSVSQISTTSTSITVVRSSSVTKPITGDTKNYKLQFRRVGASGTVTAAMSRIVFRFNI